MISPSSSVLVSVAGFDIHYYGLIMFFAIVLASLVMNFIAKRYYSQKHSDIILDILPIILIASILGARLYYVLLDWTYYSKHLFEIIAIWHGGMSIHGGIIGGLISGIYIAMSKKINFFEYADIFAFGLLEGQIIGRFGNYFNCEAFGLPCSIPFIKLYIPLEHRPFNFQQFEYFHPTFLYESLWNLFVFVILFFIFNTFYSRKKMLNFSFKACPRFLQSIYEKHDNTCYIKFQNGTIFFLYLLLYSLGRFFIEMCRLDSVKNIFGLHIAQVISIILVIVCFCFLIVLYRQKGKN